MPISYVPCRPREGQSAYDVLMVRNRREERVAHICYDKWTSTWALLHTSGLIEKFDTLLGARAGVAAIYGDPSDDAESNSQLADLNAR